jgi:hypothetical protein
VPDWSIEPLASHHVRTEFDCGESSLSNWIRQQASQFVARDLAKVYVLLRKDSPRVWGYYAISTCQIRFEELPPSIPRAYRGRWGYRRP